MRSRADSGTAAYGAPLHNKRGPGGTIDRQFRTRRPPRHQIPLASRPRKRRECVGEGSPRSLQPALPQTFALTAPSGFRSGLRAALGGTSSDRGRASRHGAPPPPPRGVSHEVERSSVLARCLVAWRAACCRGAPGCGAPEARPPGLCTRRPSGRLTAGTDLPTRSGPPPTLALRSDELLYVGHWLPPG